MLNINLEFWSNQNGITPESREMIELTRGNLLLAKADAIVNTVNTVGVMGKGIALQFSKAFPENLVAYQRACKDGSVAIGKMLVQETSSLERSLPRYIINFPTKKHWKQPSKLEYVEEGLNALVEELKRLGVRSVAVPPLGCGLGGLRWSEVLPRLIEAAQRTPDIKWLVYEPAGAPAATSMPNETVKPKMTRSIAIVIALIDRYLVPSFGYPVSLLEIQKLVYFLAVVGEKLPRIRFRAAAYGPYSDNVAHILSRADGHYILGYGDEQNKPDTPIELNSESVAEANELLSNDPHLKANIDRVARLIEGYEDPYGMELLSTVHWVSTVDDPEATDDMGRIAGAVHKWNQRKARVFRTEHIHCAWLHLKEHGALDFGAATK